MAGGVVSRKGDTYAAKKPAKIALAKDCVGMTTFKPIASSKDGEDSEEDGEEDDFEEMCLDDIKTLSDKIDGLTELVNAGFSALLGGSELETIPEESEPVEATGEAPPKKVLKPKVEKPKAPTPLVEV